MSVIIHRTKHGAKAGAESALPLRPAIAPALIGPILKLAMAELESNIERGSMAQTLLGLFTAIVVRQADNEPTSNAALLVHFAGNRKRLHQATASLVATHLVEKHARRVPGTKSTEHWYVVPEQIVRRANGAEVRARGALLI